MRYWLLINGINVRMLQCILINCSGISWNFFCVSLTPIPIKQNYLSRKTYTYTHRRPKWMNFRRHKLIKHTRYINFQTAFNDSYADKWMKPHGRPLADLSLLLCDTQCHSAVVENECSKKKHTIRCMAVNQPNNTQYFDHKLQLPDFLYIRISFHTT